MPERRRERKPMTQQEKHDMRQVVIYTLLLTIVVVAALLVWGVSPIIIRFTGDINVESNIFGSIKGSGTTSLQIPTAALWFMPYR
jgi:hypothetical protein